MATTPGIYQSFAYIGMALMTYYFLHLRTLCFLETIRNYLKRRGTTDGLLCVDRYYEYDEMMSTVNAEQSPSDDSAVSEAASPDRSLSKDDTFHILQNERRRRVLQYLSDTDGPVDMRDIAEQVAAWEHDTTVQQLTSDQRQRVYIALYQSHLPKLADFDLIVYNRSRGIVERTPLADQVASYLQDSNEDSTMMGIESAKWARYFGWATVLSIGLIALAWLGISPVTGLGLATLITAIYAAMTLGLIRSSED